MDGDFAEAVHYLAAIQLALEGAANNGSALTIIESILTAGPQCEPSDTWPTRILVNAIQANGAHIVVPGADA